MRSRNILYNTQNMKKFISKNNIENIYEIVGYSFFSFFRTTDIPHKLGVYYPDLDTDSDFCILDLPEFPDNTLIVMKCPYINEIFIYHIMQRIQKQLKKNHKNIKILLHIHARMTIFDYMYGFVKHEDINPALIRFHASSVLSTRTIFYTYNISEQELRNLVAHNIS